MFSKLDPNKSFCNIYSQVKDGKDNQHVRAACKKGQSKVYLHNSWSFGFSSARREKRDAKRKAGAAAVYRALVNQYGVKIANESLTKVGQRRQHDLRHQVTVQDIKAIRKHIQTTYPGLQIASGHEAPKGPETDVNAELVFRNANSSVEHFEANFDFERASDERGFLEDPENQEFVKRRITGIALEQAARAGGNHQDPDLNEIAETSPLVYPGDEPDALQNAWQKSEKAAQDAFASLSNESASAPKRGRDPATLFVRNSIKLVNASLNTANLTNGAAQQYDQTFEAKLDDIGNADPALQARQAAHTSATSLTPAQANEAYKNAMGMNGPARLSIAAAGLHALLHSGGTHAQQDNGHLHCSSALVTALVYRSEADMPQGRSGSRMQELSHLRDATRFETLLQDGGFSRDQVRNLCEDYRLHGDAIFNKTSPHAPLVDWMMDRAGITDRDALKKAFNQSVPRRDPKDVKQDLMRANEDRNILTDRKLNLKPISGSKGADTMGLSAAEGFDKELAPVRQRHAAYQLILAAIENPDLLTPERTEKLTKLLGEPSLWAGHAGLPSRARGFKELLEQDDPDKTKLKLRGENLAKMMASANRDVFKDLDRSLDEGRARSQIRAKGRLWQEDRFDRLIAMASGQGHGNGHNQQVNGQVQINGQAQANGHDEHGAHGHDHEAGPVGKVLGATETKYAFKAANNGLLLGDAIAHQREHLFHEELHFDLKVDAAALGLKGVEHILGLGQAVMLAKDASHHLHVTGKVRDDYRTAARTFKQADSNWKEVSLAVKTIDKGLKHMVPPEELIGGFAAALNKGQHAPATFKPRDAAVFKRVVLALSPDLSERGKQHLETYLTNADANLRENAYAQLMREVSNGLNDGSQLGFAPFENAKERLLRDLSTEKRAADAANKTMSKMVATYGKNQEVADAMRSEYKAELGIATANLIKYVAELGEDALHALHFFHDLPMKEATKAALEVAGGALGLVAGAIGAGVATYETIHEAHGAHEDKKTAQKASDVKNVFMKQTEQLSAVKANGQYETNDSVLAPRDPELAGIYETVSKHHTDLSGKKTKKAIGEATLAAGYIAGGIASGASLATGATAVGIAAAAGPVGWALLGVGAVGVIGLTAYNYAQKYIAAKENEALRKVMTGDWEALQAYAQRHDDLPELNNEQDLAARKVVQNHALAAMTKQSVRFALAQFHERLKHEVENVDSAHWGHAPTIKALSAFYKDPVQIKAIAQLGTGQAMEILAKRFQIDLPGGQAPVY